MGWMRRRGDRDGTKGGSEVCAAAGRAAVSWTLSLRLQKRKIGMSFEN
jgi:hypothetical protein